MRTCLSHRVVWQRLGLVSILMMFLQACEPAYSEPVTELVKPVKLLVVPETFNSVDYNFVAQVQATNRAQLAFQVSGEIDQLNVRMGEFVEKGDLLASLDPHDFQLAVDARQAQFELQKARRNRSEQLFEKKLISEDNYDQVQTAYTEAEANLDQAVTDLAYSKLHAPFSGVVSLTYAKQYQYVSAKQAVLSLLGTEQLDLVFNLPVTITERLDLAQLREAKLWVTLGNFKGVELPARFKEISTQPDPDTNSYSVTLTILRPEHLNILPGMSGAVYVRNESESDNGLALPKGAFFNIEEQQAQVWRVSPDNMRVEAVTVELNLQGLVIDGLSAGDSIVAAGAKSLTAGQIIRPWQREGGI
ncbi:efflux RND transporter periplasmic adaptor subunit [Agarivorans sp. 1_MG-2023]|uniref:efflux RND transporter periplasmic adaptor subunit n=1 Tax=Agarivorans sp. 1_MG-2023 TaxID=3062634 RepID=UPI0026E314BE|nr:efflux RND transporter periplasmic adaptor subunit [Agarivorans sp. 1_MG-2023]MDO6763779.1 efflux RND transporter periplasmic adaptor subunit [Agarivorans sp. 1_MG-2023]